jgi:hypothetical protein
MKMSVARTIASTFQAYQNCLKSGASHNDGAKEHKRRLEQIADDLLPSGSGIDSGTSINFELSKPERIVLDTAFHHMNDGGYYDGWTLHQVIVTASLVHGLSLRITGRDRNDIKDYLYDTFDDALTQDIDFDVTSNGYRRVA